MLSECLLLDSGNTDFTIASPVSSRRPETSVQNLALVVNSTSVIREGTNEDEQVKLTVPLIHRWSILVGLVIIVALSIGAWFLSPKGENQTIWRSTLILTFASCYIMWGMWSDFLTPSILAVLASPQILGAQIRKAYPPVENID
ncbi:H(+)-transporting V0 sector ATPase subunit e [Cladophialophora chaetospira]|uniref:H(+)-transporting V0 sector ATPase subunit e n=1 Tax=Cladophialophora chaetospira TaxID=386627 RepID=A0AA38XA50_9EURO|nr:H(+)-transporting V0 sector ATPase subunit e [Cladophialophora chaetospira]